MRNHILRSAIYAALLPFIFSSCNKLLEVDPPIDSITTEELFSNNEQADWAIAAIYSKMINGDNPSTISTVADRNFATGLSTILGGLSADELTVPANNSNPEYHASINKLTLLNSNKTEEIWTSAYKIIFDANAALEGIENSVSTLLTDSARKQLTGEALAIRSLCYFYLINFFGDVPMVLSSDFNQTLGLPRSPGTKIYEKIKADLIKASSMLGTDFSAGKGERVRINKWFAEALLARICLYTGAYDVAISSATKVIDQSDLFGVETDLTKTFTPNNREAIFQLKPAAEAVALKKATPEGIKLYNVPAPGVPYSARFEISAPLANAFEINDQRKTTWITPVGTALIPAKYKNGPEVQYYNVIRLAELHLIRAEAIMLLTPAAKSNAIKDINILRRRAGVTELDEQLSAEQVITAIAHERQVELFLEWGHRWFDLKRTGKANEVLSAVPYKQPWWGDYQFVYPVPPAQINLNSNLVQNPEYNSR